MNEQNMQQGAGDQGAAGAGASQPGQGAGSQQPAGGNAGAAGANQGGSPDVHEITINGKKENLTLDQLKARAQQVGNITQREQELAAGRKDMAAKMARLDELLQQAEKGDTTDDDETEIQKLTKEVGGLKETAAQVALDKALAPAIAKYPGLAEDEIVDNFIRRVRKGEVENSAAGIMKTAEEMITGRDTMVNDSLSKVLANHEDPRLKDYNTKLIDAYVKGKYKLSNAGGSNGGGAGAAGAAGKGSGNLADMAARLRNGYR